MMYAIVDIETTGGYANNNRVTEIAIFIHDGEQVVEEFSSLINPERPIPGYITGLTGIDDRMVQEAPLFSEIEDKIWALLQGKIFVAHNVHFDYTFLKREFEELGKNLNLKKLCTVRLSRRLIPGLNSYSLGNITNSLGIDLKDRHRARGDAEATVKLFHHLLNRDNKGVVTEFLNRNKGEMKLPPNLPKEVYDNLPEAAGVYYFKDRNKKIIYIGKAINIKKRITGHFTGSKGTWSNSKIKDEVHHIDFELTGNELIALLRENSEIMKYWPPYNKALKKKSAGWGIYLYTDRNGYNRLNINKIKRGMKPQKSFYSHQQCWDYIIDLIEHFKLCPKLCGLQTGTEACYDQEEGKCKGACLGKEKAEIYNQRVDEAMLWSPLSEINFLLTGPGRTDNEIAAVVVEEGKYSLWGFLPIDKKLDKIADIKPLLQPDKDSRYATQVINSFVEKSEFYLFSIVKGVIKRLNREEVSHYISV